MDDELQEKINELEAENRELENRISELEEDLEDERHDNSKLCEERERLEAELFEYEGNAIKDVKQFVNCLSLNR